MAVKRNLKLWMSNVLLKALPKVAIGDLPGGIWKRMHLTVEITCFPRVTASCCFTELFFPIILLLLLLFQKRGILFSGGGNCVAVHALGISLR